MKAKRPGPSWLYERVPCLDTVRLMTELGDDRPLWTRHFCNWEAFRQRVRWAKCWGDWSALWSSHGWYSDEDYGVAWNDVTCRAR